MSSSINDNESGPPQFDYEQVQMFLSGYNLMQYFELFVEEGFDRLESLLEVTETDLVQMGVKRGHRRLLQRAIANAKGIPPTVPLMLRQYQDSTTVRDMPQQNPDQKDFPSLDSDSFASSSNTQASPSSHPKLQTVSDNFIGNTSGPSGVSSAEDETAMSDTVIGLWKRKYRRHAKPDKHAPLKPPSAYVMFSNQIRSELKDHNMSFTDLAKIVGGRWKTLDRDEKEIYEANAVRARQEYAAALKEYQKTEEYRNYQAYLAEFRAKHEAAARPVGKPRKRRKQDTGSPSPSVLQEQSPSTSASLSSQSQNPSSSEAMVSGPGSGSDARSLSSSSIGTNTTNNTPTTDLRNYPFFLLNEDPPASNTTTSSNNSERSSSSSAPTSVPTSDK